VFFFFNAYFSVPPPHTTRKKSPCSAGGYSSDGYTNGRDLVLIATVDEEDYEQALQIVEESGGR